MIRYGLHIRNPDTGDLVWFRTEKPLQPGAYLLRRDAGSSRPGNPRPNVFVAESIPALVLQVGSLIQQAEDRAQSVLGMADTSRDTRHRIEAGMADGLLRNLNETSPIWVSDPAWLDDLEPVLENSG